MKKWVIGMGVGAMGLAIALAALNLVHGNLNQDEGWYLYAAKMVQGGAVPYVDFVFTQGPLLPWVYAMFYPLVDLWGVAGGRLITTVFGLFAGLLAAATAWRVSKKNQGIAFVVVLLLVSCNVYQSYFTTVVKTYALCSFFLMAGFFAISFKSRTGAWLAGGLLALAAGTRLSAGIVLPIAGVWLILQRDRRFGWLWFGIGGGLTLLAVFGPFLFSAFEQTHFGLLGYHAGRDPGELGKQLVLKAGFVSRFVQAYFIFVILVLAMCCGWAKEGWRNPSAILLGLCGAGISLVHLFAAFPYDDYQAIAYPILAVAVVVFLVPKLTEKQIAPALSMLLLLSVAAAFSSPINQDWFVRGRDRIWWQFKERSDLQQLRAAAEYIRQNSPSGSVLLTQDTYLAVESGRAVPPGMEMGPFCYYPNLSRTQAEKLNLLNQERLTETLEQSDAPLAAFSGYGLAIESPAIARVSDADTLIFEQLLDRRYEATEEFEHFGQAHTLLSIFRKRDSE